MNKVISLPRIGTHRPQIPKKASSRQRKNSIDMQYNSVIESVREKKVQNQEDKAKGIGKRPIIPMKRVKSEFLKRSTQENEDNQKEQKYSLNQNGKLKKILEVPSTTSHVIDTERSVRSISKPEGEQKEKIAAIKKELNEVISSVLILKKQIKAIEGSTLQLKEQRKGLTTTQSTNQTNEKVEQKIEQIKTKTEWSRYEQEVLKNMKDRLKQVNLNFEKKTLELKATVERQQKKVKILTQRTSIRQESINKKKHLIKTVLQNQKTANKLVELQTEEQQKRLRQLNEQKELALKGYKSISSDEYHYQEYKKMEAHLFEQLRASQFVNMLLDSKWNHYSEKYSEVEKAEKLMQMHQIVKNQGEFDPLKTYFGSFENKAELQAKIKENQGRLAASIARNKKLKDQWKQIGFNETTEEQKITNSKPMAIKIGKITQQSEQQKMQREQLVELRRKKQVAKEKSQKYTHIMNWIARLEKVMRLDAEKKDVHRLENIIRKTVYEHKVQQQVQLEDQKAFKRVFDEDKTIKA